MSTQMHLASALSAVSSPSPNVSSSSSWRLLSRNGDFEVGSLRDWAVGGSAEVVKSYAITEYSLAKQAIPLFPQAKPHSGSWFLVLGKNESSGVISQRILVPLDAAQANISFFYACAPTAGSRLSFRATDSSGKTITTYDSIATEGWKQFKFDIGTNYFGQYLTVQFQGTGIKNYQSHGGELISYECVTILDDIILAAQIPLSTPPPTVKPTPTVTPSLTVTPSPTPTLKPTPSFTPPPTSKEEPASTFTSEFYGIAGIIAVLTVSILPAALATIHHVRHRRTKAK